MSHGAGATSGASRLTATAAAIMTNGAPDGRIVLAALLYSIGAHGIMTLNDFKSIEGDRRMGIASLPVQLGPHRAALLACVTMAAAQLSVVAMLLAWQRPLHAVVIGVMLAGQIGVLHARECGRWARSACKTPT